MIPNSKGRRSAAIYLIDKLAGAGGFEPPYAGIKIRCLTTWLRPIAALVGSGGTRDKGAAVAGRGKLSATRRRGNIRGEGELSGGCRLGRRGLGGGRGAARLGEAMQGPSGRGGARFGDELHGLDGPGVLFADGRAITGKRGFGVL